MLTHLLNFLYLLASIEIRDGNHASIEVVKLRISFLAPACASEDEIVYFLYTYQHRFIDWCGELKL